MPPNKRLLDVDEVTGITEYYHFDPDTNGFLIETVQDVEGLIDLNTSQANDSTGWKGDWHHVARIPLSVLLDLSQQGIVTPAGKVLDEKRYRAWLNDPDNRAFRTKLGRI